jgi:hypothetical protein
MRIQKEYLTVAIVARRAEKEIGCPGKTETVVSIQCGGVK